MSVIRFFYDDELDTTTAGHDMKNLTSMEKLDFMKDALGMLEISYNAELRKTFRKKPLKSVKK